MNFSKKIVFSLLLFMFTKWQHTWATLIEFWVAPKTQKISKNLITVMYQFKIHRESVLQNQTSVNSIIYLQQCTQHCPCQSSLHTWEAFIRCQFTVHLYLHRKKIKDYLNLTSGKEGSLSVPNEVTYWQSGFSQLAIYCIK